MLVVGDGVPDSARPAVERVVASDPRVRFLDRAKGPEHGFRHRDEAIQEARGDIVLYLADDDIWLPQHVEILCEALEEADFVASLPLALTRSEVRLKVPHDLAEPHWKKRLLEGRSTINLSLAGHTRELYSRLETGWRRDDALYAPVWRDFAIHAEQMRTIRRVTAVVLPDKKRADMSQEERLAELAEISALVSGPEGRLELMERLLEHEVQRWSRATLELERLRAKRKS